VEEIARALELDISERAVKSELAAARAWLKERL
jgi:hypothetical protein